MAWNNTSACIAVLLVVKRNKNTFKGEKIREMSNFCRQASTITITWNRWNHMCTLSQVSFINTNRRNVKKVAHLFYFCFSYTTLVKQWKICFVTSFLSYNRDKKTFPSPYYIIMNLIGTITENNQNDYLLESVSLQKWQMYFFPFILFYFL